jgi:hypothetical protein
MAGEVAAPPLSRAMAGSRDLAWFVLLVAIAHAVRYFLVGVLAYTTLTHGLYEGAGQDCGWKKDKTQKKYIK